MFAGKPQISLLERRYLLMRMLRTLLCWLFGISSLFCLWNASWLVLRIMHRHDAFQTSRSFLIAGILPVFAVIYSVAWWTVWKEKPTARGWGIAASLINVLFPVWGIFHSSRSLPGAIGIMFGVGVAGLVAFLWRNEQHGHSQVSGGI